LPLNCIFKTEDQAVQEKAIVKESISKQIAEQIAEQLCTAIVDGRIKIGERLPTEDTVALQANMDELLYYLLRKFEQASAAQA
jgi:DNA-binding GntR family transcriptional regulator